MSSESARYISSAMVSAVTIMVLGEIFGGAVSRPIAAWRVTRMAEAKVFERIDAIEQQLSKLLEEEETK